ncbi:MAG TPA: O-antigen ligase family protein [Candidatus Limnocylindrales bacterium]|nr:O-antigen ligase family protein [Candidatus Limnocylindrales bacterium]
MATLAPELQPTAARPARPIGPLVAVAMTIAISLSIGAVAAHEPVLAVAGVLAALAAVAIGIRPDAAVLIVVGLIYSNAPVVFVQFHSVPLALAASVPLILAAPLAYDLLVRRQKIVLTPAMPWIALFLIAELLSTITAQDTSDAASSLSTFASEGIGLYLLVTNTVRSTDLLRAIVWTLLLVGAFLGALSFYQQITETYGNAYFGFAQTEAAATGVTETGIARLAGPIGEKNRYAQIMLMLVPLGVLQFSGERNRWLKLAALACAGLAAIATALTFSRGAALAAGIILVAMLLLRYIRLSHLVVSLALIGVVLVAVPEYGARVSSLTDLGALFSDEPAGSTTDNSLLSRATENLTALQVFADHPILGVGPGQFPNYYRDYADEIGVSVRAADREAHNLYLGIAAETGIVGLTAFLGAVVATFVQLARARARALTVRPDLAAMAAGFMLALVGYLASGLFLHLSYARYYWLMLALAGAAATVILEVTRERPAEPAELPSG